MYVLRIACQEPNGQFYYDTGLALYESYDKALLTAYSLALGECADLNLTGNEDGNWFEVSEYQEYPDAKGTGISAREIYPVSITWYDHPIYDRENDLCYMMVSGYQPVKVDDFNRYNARLKRLFGSDITVRIKFQFNPEGGKPEYLIEAASAEFDPYSTCKQAFDIACSYLKSL